MTRLGMVLGGLEVVGKRSVRSKAKLEIIPSVH